MHRFLIITSIFLVFFLNLLIYGSSKAQIINPAPILWLKADSIVHIDNRIEKWIDKSGNNNDALQENISSQPILEENIPELNFKSAVKFDGQNDVLNLSGITNIKSVVLITKHRTGHQATTQLFGHSSKYNFHGGTIDTLLFSTFASKGILDGTLRLNGTDTDPLKAIKPTEYTIISILSSKDLSVSSISKDRNQLNSLWDGNYAEILFFSEELNINELKIIEAYLRKEYTPELNLPSILTTENFCSIALNATTGFKQYLWSTGDTTTTTTATKPGKYWVEVTDIFGFTLSDTVEVVFPGSFISDQQICMGDTLNWNLNLSTKDYEFTWQDGSQDSIISIRDEGEYFVKIKDSLGCVFNSDTIKIDVDKFAERISLGNDTTFCSGNKITLKKGKDETVSYLWNNNSTKPELQITETGYYWSKFTNSNGCVGTDSIHVTIQGKAPEIDFNFLKTCEKDTVVFDALNIGSDTSRIVQWDWKINELTSHTGITAKYYPATTDTIFVSLRATNSTNCSQNTEKHIPIYPKPFSKFNSSKGCNGDEIILNDESSIASGNIVKWNWFFDDKTSSSGKSISKVFSTAGYHHAKLFVESDKHCIDTITDTIFIFKKPLTSFSYNNTCQGEITEFTQRVDTSNVGFVKLLWNFGGGLFSSLPKTKHYFEEPGEYPINLKATRADNLCFHDTTILVTIYDLPEADFMDETLCLNNDYLFKNTSSTKKDPVKTYTWYLDKNFFSNQKNPNFTPLSTGNKNVALKVTTNNGCTDSLDKNIFVSELPTLDFSFSPEIGLPPLEVNFTNLSSSPNLLYRWQFGNGESSIDKHPTTIFKSKEKFNIQLVGKNEFGCQDSISKPIFIEEPEMDLIVEDILTEYNSKDVISISTKIVNVGNLNISNLSLKSSVGNDFELFENWEGYLPSNSFLIYQFKASLKTESLEKLPIICIEVNAENQTNMEEILDNNKLCKSVANQAFKIINPKNPQSIEDDFRIFIISSTNQTIRFEFWDVYGKKTANFENQTNEGFNQFEFNIPQLKGLFILKISTSNQAETFKLTRF